ncbi:AI-2E family transporter, partial [bacterium]|nr:AI-2E family transporter [bacterium]
MDSKSNWRMAAIVVIAAFLILLTYILRSVLLPVLIALLFAYLLDPVIDRLERWRLNRSLAILILAVVVLIVVGTLGGFLALQAQQEMVAFYKKLPDYLNRIQTDFVPWVETTLNITLPHTMEEFAGELRTNLLNIDPASLRPVTTFASKLSSSTLALISSILGLIIIPVFLFYFLRDWDKIMTQVLALIPLKQRDYVLTKAAKIDEIVGAFIRGQLTVAITLGILYSSGLVIIGLDLAVVIGMLAGIGFIIPYLGTVLGIIAATVMALVQFGIAWQVLGAWAVFGVVQLFEGTILTPKIMGEKVGLSPVAVIFSLMVGAKLMGVVGMLIAVPAAAVLNVFINEALARYRQSDLMK